MNHPTVLHADDNEGVRRLSSRRFEAQAGALSHLSAASAEDAMQTLETRDIDCLVSDSLTLGDGTPFVVAASERFPDLPIVLFTASEWEDVREQVREANVVEYVHKDGGDRMGAVVEYVVDLLEARSSPVESSFGDDWRVIARHDWESPDDLGTAIVQAIESFSAVDLDALPPLYESVDAEALEELLRPRESSPGGNVGVRFDYEAHELVVTSDGLILGRRHGDATAE